MSRWYYNRSVTSEHEHYTLKYACVIDFMAYIENKRTNHSGDHVM